MNKVIQIIILDDQYQIINENILVINDNVELIDDVTIKLSNNDIYNFDYLIFSNPSFISNFRETNILHDAGIPVTNFFHQTTYENIYYSKDIDIAINNIFEDDN